MKKVSLSGSIRKNVGKKDASDLRNSGRVPCVVYGGKEQTSFSVSEIELKKLVWNPNVYQFDLNIDGKIIPAIMKDIQFHPVTDRVAHVDFFEIIPNKPLKVKLPVRLTGASEGVKKGGKLFQNFRKVTVLGLAEALPEVVEVNVEKLNIGDMIRVKELAYEGIRIMEQGDAVICAVKTTRATAEETPVAGAPAAAAAAATPAAKTPAAKK